MPPQVAERALEWLVELQSQPVPPETLAEWTRWRAAHADHERAWQRIESVRGRLQPLASQAGASIAQAALAPRGSSRRRQIIKTLTVLIFAGGSAWGVAETPAWREWRADYRTTVGQRRNVTLADGTQLMLNTRTAADIAFSATERRVRLIAGELLATTGKDLVRPFLIETTHGTAHALGTRYIVKQLDDGTEVSVFEGAVRIEPRGAPEQAIVLQAGEQARFDYAGIDTRGRADDTAIGWTDGFIIARSMRLDDFLAELSRYSADSFSADPDVAGLRVSGSFPVANLDAVIQTLAGTLELQAETRDRFWGGRRIRMGPLPPKLSALSRRS